MVAFDVDEYSVSLFDANEDQMNVPEPVADEEGNFRTISRLMMLDAAAPSTDGTGSIIYSQCRNTRRRDSDSKSEVTSLKMNHNGTYKTDDDDIYETGQWGTVSRRDKLCFVCTLVLLLTGSAIGITLALLYNAGESASMPSSMSIHPNGSDGASDESETAVKGTSTGITGKHNTNSTLYRTATEQYNALRDSIQLLATESTANVILLHLPENINDLPSTGDDMDIYKKAVLWFLYTDTVTSKYESELVPRFVLILTYLSNGGATWNQQEKWMTSYHVCLWYGIRCHRNNDDVMEVDMSRNGLSGPIHKAWELLAKCTSILLDGNKMSGTIPGDVFGSMEALEYLYLQNNELVGTIPSTLKTNGSLGTKIYHSCFLYTCVYNITFQNNFY
jgi:hypothetical protein